MSFTDRRDAGRQLAQRLRQQLTAEGPGAPEGPVVLALPRGGVPVAAEIARELGAPLDVFVARKIGAPGQRELAVGALAGEDPPVFDRRALQFLGLAEEELAADVARERTELHRREDLYRGKRPELVLTGRTVILVDDGLATGMTATAALRNLRRRGPARVVLAVPVASPTTAAALAQEADEVVCLSKPPDFRAVGEWYEDFTQVSDEHVIEALRAAT
ncbi:phosphoribosyltransferase [Streptomyces purpurogeneiscleroticus]|uniref:phosphoribosyltransferase n=1 Tax=Streptomyces purpurogeneiscleroticus TaxID=68259 RepID=UPI001CBF8740|nr:phosphoribosyltransferase [Streptomyces purpurogeneiscleroticus]MBZ4016844.1 phosphoribosyltransferase [Streptomyces purpurogeneiscleroticus]